MDNPLRHTRRTMIELSNLCDLAWFHKKCPLHNTMRSPTWVKNPMVLPSEIVYHVLNTLGKYNYAGLLSFHGHSEPLADPRLFMFIKYAREQCPDVRIYLITNAVRLEQTIAKELLKMGVHRVIVSIYGKSEEQMAKAKRYREINKAIGVTRTTGEALIGIDRRNMGKFDDRLNWYKRPPRKDDMGKCGAPLKHLMITKDADIALCCWEWRHDYIFGNLKEQTLEEILSSPKVLQTFKRLMSGDRFLDYCKACHTRQT